MLRFNRKLVLYLVPVYKPHFLTEPKDDPDGLNVCLHCYNGGCPRLHSSSHHSAHNHPVVLNVRRTRRIIERDEPPLKKLAIAAETEADRYDTRLAVSCLECATQVPVDQLDSRMSAIVDAVMTANTFSRREEVKAWEQELSTCEHILTMQQTDARKIQSGDLGYCSACSLNENLWLCLECGNLGCGRQQLGGLDGNGHGLAHSKQSGHGVAVKLGSITPEGTADIYCYKCDDERLDENLGAHLAHWGIILGDRQKTEKSLTEMQIEQNLSWDFSMTNEDGKTLTPLFGEGLTGLKNLGNSCYLASIIQCLFDTAAFKERYYQPEASPVETNGDPASDLETQLRKMANGLWSGRYSTPDSNPQSARNDASTQLAHQRGITPSMFKHLVGRDHAEFSTMRQQDAFEFLQHLFKLVTRSRHGSASDPTQQFRFTMEQRLQCIGCRRVRYTTIDQDNVFLTVPLELVRDESDANNAASYQSVTLKDCLDNLTAGEVVDLTCSACGGKDGYVKRSLFKTLPEILAVNARKMTIVNWVPIKIDVPVLVPDGPFNMDPYLSQGLQVGEEELPEDPVDSTTQPTFVPNAEALTQLQEMGFSRNRCEKALYATNNADSNTAMEWLFEHMDDADIDEPLVLAASAAPSAPDDPEKIAMLESMGFSAPQAKKALRETGADVERAVEWVFSHPDDHGVLDDNDEPAVARRRSGSQSTVGKPSFGTAETPAMYRLQSIVCHKGTSIHAG